MKVSLTTTVMNEKNSIEEFLNSVIKQTRRPDEFIIVDGGSNDGTYEILVKYSKKYRWMKAYQVKGASVGRGRNIAISKAKYKIIASTDAGCILDKNWLKNIVKPFEDKNVDVVVGVYKPLYKNEFEHFEGLIVVPEIEKTNSPSRMSARSLAFKKNVWKKVGGFPNLITGEDTLFHLKLKKAGFRYAFAKDAIIFWRMRKNWKEFAKQFYKYGVGDRKSGNIFKMKTNFLMVIGFWTLLAIIIYFMFSDLKMFAILVGVSFLYFLNKGLELFLRTKKIKALYYGTVLFFLKRTCYILGVSVGK
ncbi:MAG: glycosyltransferase [Candidatus Nanoarchaeia archaeon]